MIPATLIDVAPRYSGGRMSLGCGDWLELPIFVDLTDPSGRVDILIIKYMRMIATWIFFINITR